MNIHVKLKTYESMDYDDVDVPTELSGLANCSTSIISNKAESSKSDESIWLNPVNLFNVRKSNSNVLAEC